MGQIVEEVQLWNTPAIGAYYLWRFTQGYINNHPSGDAPIGLLHFIAIAILTNNKLSRPVSNSRFDLQSYVRSFEETKDSDTLLNIQERVKEKQKYSWQAIDIAVHEGLLFWDVDSGKLYSKDILKAPTRGSALKEVHVKEGKKAEILGKWFSQHDISSISKYLKIVF